MWCKWSGYVPVYMCPYSAQITVVMWTNILQPLLICDNCLIFILRQRLLNKKKDTQMKPHWAVKEEPLSYKMSPGEHEIKTEGQLMLTVAKSSTVCCGSQSKQVKQTESF